MHPWAACLLGGMLLLSALGSERAAGSETDSAIRLSGVPFFPQEEMGCGPAALASVLAFWGLPVSLEEITEEVYLDRMKGSLPLDLMLAAQRRGLKATAYAGSLEDLRIQLESRQPLIAFLNLRWRQFPQGHFVVVTGFDRSGPAVIVHSGLRPNEKIPADRFLQAWARTGFWTLRIHPERDG